MYIHIYIYMSVSVHVCIYTSRHVCHACELRRRVLILSRSPRVVWWRWCIRWETHRHTPPLSAKPRLNYPLYAKAGRRAHLVPIEFMRRKLLPKS